MLGKDKQTAVSDKQFDPNKYPIFNGKKSLLTDWEKLAKMYLRKQDRAEWVMESNNAASNAIISPGWMAQQKMDDQYTAYQLLYVTFQPFRKTILDQVNEGANDSDLATQAWKDIWTSYVI
eukprot:3565149-Rhodomonas_salina.1